MPARMSFNAVWPGWMTRLVKEVSGGEKSWREALPVEVHPGLGGGLQIVDETLEHTLLYERVAAVGDAFIVVGGAGEFPVNGAVIEEG